MKLKNQNGVALVMVMVFMTMSFVGLQSYSLLGSSQLIAEDLFVKHHQAFYLAEAGAEDAKARLRDDFSTFPVAGDSNIFTMGDGEYYFNVAQTINPAERRITAYGAVPDFATATATKIVEVVLLNNPNIFDYAIYSTGDIRMESSAVATGQVAGGQHMYMESSATVNGDILVVVDVHHIDSAAVNGNITVGGTISCVGSSCGYVTGSQTQGANVNFTPPNFDLDDLRAIAQSQTYDGHDNHYTVVEIAAGVPALPVSFYFTPPAGSDPGVPHVVFMEDDLNFASSEVIGGFLVVNAMVRLNGSVQVNGVIYSENDLRLQSSVVLDGSLITKSPNPARVESSVLINWNSAYADALKAHPGIQSAVGGLSQTSWNEK